MVQDRFTYVNCRGDVYYLRAGKSGRGGGIQIICSKKCMPEALEAIPEGMEIVESPNGKVSLPQETAKRDSAAGAGIVGKMDPQVVQTGVRQN